MTPYKKVGHHSIMELLYNGKQKWGHYVVNLTILAI